MFQFPFALKTLLVPEYLVNKSLYKIKQFLLIETQYSKDTYVKQQTAV